MKDVLKRMDGFELKGRKLELRPVSMTHIYDSFSNDLLEKQIVRE